MAARTNTMVIIKLENKIIRLKFRELNTKGQPRKKNRAINLMKRKANRPLLKF